MGGSLDRGRNGVRYSTGLLGGIYALLLLSGDAVARYVAAVARVVSCRSTVLRLPALSWLIGAGLFAVLLAALELFS